MKHTATHDIYLFVITFCLCNILHFTIQSNDPVDLLAQAAATFPSDTFTANHKELFDILDSGSKDLTKFEDLLKNNIVNLEAVDTKRSKTQQYTLLQQAIKNNNDAATDLLLSYGANVNAIVPAGNQSVLDVTAHWGNAHALQKLLANKNLVVDPDNDILTKVVYSNDLNKLDVLLNDKRFDVNKKDSQGETPLHKVARRKVYWFSSKPDDRTKEQLTLINFLLAHGADKTIKDYSGATPYFAAGLTNGNQKEVLDALT